MNNLFLRMLTILNCMFDLLFQKKSSEISFQVYKRLNNLQFVINFFFSNIVLQYNKQYR